MAGKRCKPDEVVSLLQQAEVLHGQGLSMAGAIRQLGIGETRVSPRLAPTNAGMEGEFA